MKNSFSFALALSFAVLVVGLLLLLLRARTANAIAGDKQLLMAFNAAYYEVVQSGEYNIILEKWGVGGFDHDVCSPKDSELYQWPENPEGLLRTILIQSKVIAFGHDIGGSPPFWNGTGGLDDDLAAAVTARIGTHYNVPNLSYRWVTPVIDPNGYFESLYQNLDTLGSDMILSNVAVNEYRESLVDFTCSYLYASSAVVRNQLDPELTQLMTLEQINAPGVKVALHKGSVYEPLKETLTQAEVYIGDDLYHTLEMVADNRVHVAVTLEAFVVGWQPTFRSREGNTLHNITIYPYGQRFAFGAFIRKASAAEETSDSSDASSIAIANSIVLIVALASAFILAVVA